MREAINTMYRSCSPGWEVGRPRAEVIALFREGAISSPVLDVGCGTGDNALFLAGQGLDVVGIDVSDEAIRMARSKANRRRETRAEFLRWNALDLGRLPGSFACAVDCGLLHMLGSDRERVEYTRGLAARMKRNGTVYVLCIHGPSIGPYPSVTRAQLKEAFTRNWSIRDVRNARYETLQHPTGGEPALLLRATVETAHTTRI